MKKLILHVGLHKTGTSSIQQAIVGREADLAAAGWAAPPFLGRKDSAHHIWVKRLREDAEKGIDGLVKALEALPAEQLLFSSEALAHWLLVPEQAKALGKALRRRFETRVVIYLRRQDFLKESVYAQIVKTHFRGGIDNPGLYDLAFDRRLRTLDGAFGRRNVTPRIYRDDAPFDAVEDFRVLLGLPRTPATSAASTRANVSMPRRKVMFLGETVKKGRPHAEVLATVAQVAQTQAIRDDGIRFLLSPQKRAKLVAKYAKGNEAICRRYGLDADAAYFTDATPSAYPWLPPQPITDRERADVTAEIEPAIAQLRQTARTA